MTTLPKRESHLPPKLASEGDYSQLLKLLSLVIHEAGGEITISAASLADSAPPKGFSKKWDNDKKQLILRVIEEETEVFLCPSNLDSQQVTPGMGLAKEQPILIPFRSPEQSLEQPVLSRLAKRPESDHRVIDDARALELERNRQRDVALKEIMSYQPPEQERAERFVESLHRKSPTTTSTRRSSDLNPQRGETEILDPTYFRA